MMTNEEAIERIRYQDEHVDCKYDLCDNECSKCWKAVSMANEALEKYSPPKKPILTDHDHEDYFEERVTCGACKNVIGSWIYGVTGYEINKTFFIKHHKYCNECGQKIDWSDEE